MLETLIKRDGSTEQFTNKKANNWMFWAGKGLEERIDWTTIITEVRKTCLPVMTSQDYQKRLINDLADRGSSGDDGWPAMKMAGALNSVLTLKQVHGDAYPGLSEHYRRMIDLSVMRDMGYDESELSELQTVLDHESNFLMSYSQVEQFNSRYALRDNVTKQIYETPQFTMMRMAMAVAEKQPLGKRVAKAKEIYEQLRLDQINPPTPNYGGLGTNHFGLASCCLIAAGDTAESIAAAGLIAEMETVASAGIGMHVDIRSSGDPVAGGRVEHAGILNYERKFFAQTNANKQGQRGGAITLYLNIFHPEVELQARLQNPLTPEALRERRVNVALVSNPLFVRKVNKRENYFTFTSFSAPDLYKAFYAGDQTEFETLYEKYENDPDFKKDYRSAYDTAVMFKNQANEISTVFDMDIQQANYHTPFTDTILSSNLCVAPETEVLTDQGFFPIETLSGLSVKVWNGFEYSVVDVEKTSDDSELLKVVFDNGLEIECTPYHKFYIQEGFSKSPIAEVRAGELRPGMALIKSKRCVVGGARNLEHAYANGFFTADGCATKSGNRIDLYGEKKALRNEFIVNNWSERTGNDRISGFMKGLRPKYFVPLSDYTVDSRLEWLAGFLDGDGCVYRNGTNQHLTASSIDKMFLREVVLMLQTLGIQARISDLTDEGDRYMPDGKGGRALYRCQRSYRLLINSTETQELLELGINLRRLRLVKDTPQRNAAHFVRVEEVIRTGRRDVTYCFTEPKRHTAIFNGLITGQCMEILNPTKPFYSLYDLVAGDGNPEKGEVGFCNIGSVSVHKHPLDLNNPKLGYEGYKKAVRGMLEIIDYAIDNNHYSFPSLEIQGKSRRNASVGMSGIATLFAQLNLKFDSDEGRRATHLLAERHFFACAEVALEMGKERGNAPWMHRTKWPEGWLPIDTYKKAIDKYVDSSLVYDWEELRRKIIDNKGIRFSSLVAHMPGEQATRKGDGSNSIYPLFRLSVNKSDGKSNTPWAAKDNDLIGHQYQNAYDISYEDLMTYYGILQKFNDQSASADTYKNRVKNPNLDSNELARDFLIPRTRGAKTLYYSRSLTTISQKQEEIQRRTQQEQVPDDEMEGPACTLDGACGA